MQIFLELNKALVLLVVHWLVIGCPCGHVHMFWVSKHRQDKNTHGQRQSPDESVVDWTSRAAGQQGRDQASRSGHLGADRIRLRSRLATPRLVSGRKKLQPRPARPLGPRASVRPAPAPAQESGRRDCESRELLHCTHTGTRRRVLHVPDRRGSSRCASPRPRRANA